MNKKELRVQILNEANRDELLRKIEHQLNRIADALEEKNTTAENSDVINLGQHVLSPHSKGTAIKLSDNVTLTQDHLVIERR